MKVRETSVEISEELLAAVQRELGTATVNETIEQAFREVLRAKARRDEVEALATMDGMDLADPRVMAGAWRSPPERVVERDSGPPGDQSPGYARDAG